jgi:geranylgeranyl pyrophosphate synthase
MTPYSSSIEKMKSIIEQRGGEALRKARAEILSKFTGNDAVSEALRYFADVTLRKALPVFPTLISLSCEAAEGSTEKTPPIGAAVILIAGAADLHDDIIDGSTIKGNNRTVFGKYGGEVTLLAGDTLLIQGIVLLQKECEAISKTQRQRILQLVAETSFEISKAEALDSQIKTKLEVRPQDYLDIIRLKASVPELTMEIGAILANGNMETVASLGQFGKTYGIVSLVAEEFMDLIEYREFKSRLKNECPPLPVLYAFQDEQRKNMILPLLSRKRLRKNDFQEIVSLVMESMEVQKLKNETNSLVEDCLIQLDAVSPKKAREELATLISTVSESFKLEGI